MKRLLSIISQYDVFDTCIDFCRDDRIKNDVYVSMSVCEGKLIVQMDVVTWNKNTNTSKLSPQNT